MRVTLRRFLRLSCDGADAGESKPIVTQWSVECGDAELVALALSGERTAFAALFERHQALLRALCRRALGDPLLVEDAVQEAALQALLGLAALRQPEHFGSWLAGIGLNICRRMLRRRGQADWSWDAIAGGRYLAEPIDPGPQPSSMVEVQELRAVVRRAVAGLPRGQRAAVLLFYLRGLTYAETAATLGIEIGAVRTRLHKARRALRTSLQQLWQEEAMTAEVEEQFVAVRVKDVRSKAAEAGWQSPHIVVLEDAAGGRLIPIWVGPQEGTAIALLLEQVQPPRPLTYRFMADVLAACGGRVREVRITRLTGDTFFAATLIEAATGRAEVDARPSDALALALSVGAPIAVQSQIFAQIAQTNERWQTAEGAASGEWPRGAAVIAEDARQMWTRRQAPPECEQQQA